MYLDGSTGGITVGGTIQSGNITILSPIPILVFKDSDSLGAASTGYIEWRDSGGGRAGFFGNASSGDDDLSWKNEQGGHLKLQTTGAGKLQIFADTVLNGTTLDVSNSTKIIEIFTNDPSSLTIVDTTTNSNYIQISTLTGSECITFGNGLNADYNFIGAGKLFAFGGIEAAHINITDVTEGYKVSGIQVLTFVDDKSLLLGGAGNTTMSTGGNGNICIGEQAGLNLTSGDGNLLFGAVAGISLTTGVGNILIGRGAQASSPSANDELNIGGILRGSTTSGSEFLSFPHDKKFFFGTGSDVSIQFDSEDMIINSEGVTASDELHFTNFVSYNFDSDIVLLGNDSKLDMSDDDKIISIVTNSQTALILKDETTAANYFSISTATGNEGMLIGGANNPFFTFVGNGLLSTGGGITVGGSLAVNSGWIYFHEEAQTPTPVAEYGALHTKPDNSLYFQDGDGNNHLVHGDAFSNIWFHAVSSVEVTIATQDSLTLIDSFTVVGHEDDLSNAVGNTTTNTITIASTAGGEYEISYHGSITATGGADKEMMFAFGITLATPKDITNVTDDTVTPIVITSTGHGLENGDMVEIVGVLGNTAANGSFIVDSVAPNTFEIVALDGTATTGNGDYDEGSPTGDITIVYPGNMEIHRMVRGADFGSISATGLHVLSGSDVLSIYVANLSGITNLTVSSISFSAFRIGD